MKSYIGLAMFLIITLSNISFAAPADGKVANTNSELIEKAQRLYGEGKIEEAEHLALKIISEDNDLTKYEKHNAYRLLAFCSIAADNIEAGKKHFISAISNNPNMTADPLTWSPKLRTVFDSAILEVNRQKKIEREWIFASEAQLSRRASLKSLYLPGSGQKMKKQRSKGILLGALTYAMATGYIYGQLYLPTVRDKYLNADTPALAESRWKDYRNARYTVNITGLAALAIYGYTFMDALWSTPAPEAVTLPSKKSDD